MIAAYLSGWASCHPLGCYGLVGNMMMMILWAAAALTAPARYSWQQRAHLLHLGTPCVCGHAKDRLCHR
jgi:hypothetical protein